MRMRLVVVLFFFLSCHLFSQAVKYPYILKNYNEKQGLANNTVFRMEMDAFGFLWLITWDGLSRFDGHTFKNYYHDPNDSTSIPYFTPNDICIDRSNNIWVLSDVLSRYDRETDRFITYRPGSKYNIPSQAVYSATKDNQGILFVYGSGGILKYNDRTGGFDKIQIENTGYKDLINKDSRLIIDDQGDFWICNTKTCILYHGKNVRGKRNSTVITFSESIPFQIDVVKSGNFVMEFKLHSLADGNYVIASNVGLCYLDKINHKTRLITKPDTRLLNELKHDVVWSSIYTGLYHYDATGKKLKHFPVGFTGAVTNYLLDKNDILWFGSFQEPSVGSGLNQIKKREYPWKYYPEIEKKQRENLAVFAICEDSQGMIWVVAKNLNQLIVIDLNGSLNKVPITTTGDITGAFNPRSILIDSQNSIWVGTLEGYLFKTGPDKKKFDLVYPASKSNKDECSFHSIKILNNFSTRHILATGYSGNALINVTSHDVDRFIQNVTGDFYSVYLDRNGPIWMGNVGQLLKFDRNFNLNNRIKISNGKYNIEDIVSIDDSVLWLALLGGGICSYNTISGKQKLFTKRQGLSNNVVYAILTDKAANLWMSTNDGISMLNTTTGQFVNYGAEDDLEIKEFNSDAALVKKDGMMMFGGIGGIVGFYPDSLQQRNTVAESRIIINELKCSGYDRSCTLPVFDKQNLDLPRGIKSVNINFSEINFYDQTKTNFRYRILGFKDNWDLLPKGTRSMEMTGFKPGSYTIEIAGTDNSGAWSKQAHLHIYIPPHYYETLLFRRSIEFIVVVLLIVFTVLRSRHISLIHKQRLTHLKQLMLLEQLNPHFISNSLMAVEELSAKGDEVKTNEYIARLYSLLRKMMDYRGKEFVSILDEVVLIEDFLKAEQMRIGFDYLFHYCTGQDHVLIAPSFIQPLIENAIKHGLAVRNESERKLMVRIDCFNKGNVLCTVEDNGKGFDHTSIKDNHHSGKSKSWKIMIERLSIYQALFRKRYAWAIQPVDPASDFPGTRITLEIPAKIEES